MAVAPRLGQLKRDTTGSSHSGRLASDFSTFPLASDIIYIPSLGVTGHYNKVAPGKASSPLASPQSCTASLYI